MSTSRMNITEYIEYLLSYIKACKIKGDSYILVYVNHLYIIDQDMSSLYIIDLEYANTEIPIICNRLSAIQSKDYSINYNIFNMMIDLVRRYTHYPISLFKQIYRSEVDYEIPSKATENSRFTNYYPIDDPSTNILIPEFYNMVPITKADTFDMYLYTDPYNNTSILLYKVYKKKPKTTITIYRKILNLR
jgi:hypothetical protein